jgi:multidrug efflux pump subunit AcrB
MASNSVAANLLMLCLVVGGLLALLRVKQEVFPQFELDTIIVNAVYPGASPAEVEQGTLLAIEEAVREVDGIKEVRSTASEGVGVVMVDMQLGRGRPAPAPAGPPPHEHRRGSWCRC